MEKICLPEKNDLDITGQIARIDSKNVKIAFTVKEIFSC